MSFPPHSPFPPRGGACRTAGARLCRSLGEAWGEDTSEHGRGIDLGARLGPSLSPLMSRQLAKAARVEALRCDLARLEGAPKGSSAYLPLGPDEVHAHLPGPGLPCGTLNEIAAEAYGHTPAAFGFALTLLALALHARPGPAVLVLQSRCRMDFGAPYGHGLVQWCVDPDRPV